MCTVIALSGADCEEVRNYILNSINIFVNAFVYIQNEPVKLTKIKSGRRRREVALLHPHTHPLVSDYWADVVSALAGCKSVLVLCTMSSIDFWRCNL